MDWGAETILLAPAVLPGSLFLRKLPVRGIFQVNGDGDGNISLKEKEVLGLSSKLEGGSGSLDWGDGVSNVLSRIGVNGLLRPERFDGRPIITSSEEFVLMEVASNRVGSSDRSGTMVGVFSCLAKFPGLFRFLDDITSPARENWGLKKGRHLCGASSTEW